MKMQNDERMKDKIETDVDGHTVVKIKVILKIDFKLTYMEV